MKHIEQRRLDACEDASGCCLHKRLGPLADVHQWTFRPAFTSEMRTAKVVLYLAYVHESMPALLTKLCHFAPFPPFTGGGAKWQSFVRSLGSLASSFKVFFLSLCIKPGHETVSRKHAQVGCHGCLAVSWTVQLASVR